MGYIPLAFCLLSLNSVKICGFTRIYLDILRESKTLNKKDADFEIENLIFGDCYLFRLKERYSNASDPTKQTVFI